MDKVIEGDATILEIQRNPQQRDLRYLTSFLCLLRNEHTFGLDNYLPVILADRSRRECCI